MRLYQGKKVLYFSYPSMFRTEPLRWLIYFLFSVGGVGLVLFVNLTFPALFGIDPLLRWIVYVLMLAIAGVGVGLFVLWWFRVYAERLVLTNEEAIFIKGVFNTSLTEIRLSDIRAVEVEQSFWNKLMGIGTIRIASAGSDGWEIDIRGLPNPPKVRRIINQGRHGTNSDD